jgi:hypothetical protein
MSPANACDLCRSGGTASRVGRKIRWAWAVPVRLRPSPYPDKLLAICNLQRPCALSFDSMEFLPRFFFESRGVFNSRLYFRYILFKPSPYCVLFFPRYIFINNLKKLFSKKISSVNRYTTLKRYFWNSTYAYFETTKYFRTTTFIPLNVVVIDRF